MTQALAGVRVIDLSTVIAGPYCSQLLGDMGADVIKVERPATAPSSRGLSGSTTGTRSASVLFLNCNRNKRSVSLNLGSEAGKSVLSDLVKKSDVVVENFSQHARKSLGIDEQWGFAQRQDIVWASLTGYGRTGPERERAGWDLLAQARSGLMSVIGEPDGRPLRAGNSPADFMGGLHLAVGILGALHHRDRTGMGQLVDVALLDSLVACLDGLPLWWPLTGGVLKSQGNFGPLRNLPAYAVFRCKDGYHAFGVAGALMWERMTALMGRPDLRPTQDLLHPDDPEEAERFWNEAVAAVENWASQRTKAEIRAAMDGARLPNEAVQDLRDIWSDPQLEARNMFVDIEYEPLGMIKVIGSPIHLSETPLDVRMPIPRPGEHNWQVLTEVLGYTEDQVAELAANNALEE